jgi:hypothetical protein
MGEAAWQGRHTSVLALPVQAKKILEWTRSPEEAIEVRLGWRA